MPWIGANAQPRRNEQAQPPASLEQATTISGRGTAPANAVIEHLTAHECRLRTVVFFDATESVEFDFTTIENVRIRARGRIAERHSKGPRFIYRIRLDRMDSRETESLARAVALLHRRQANERSHRRAIDALPTTESLARTSHRAVADFTMLYRTARENPKSAQASDVSTGGLAMTCRDALIPGEHVEVRFTMPSEVLDVHPEQTALLDLRTRSVAHVRADMRRPFQEILVRARVVSHQPLGEGTFKYGLSFLDLTTEARNELARYVHAIQLARRKHSVR